MSLRIRDNVMIITYNDMVTNDRPQLEKPISIPAAIPVGANFLNDFLQSI